MYADVIISSGGLSALILEGVKLFWRRVIVKNPAYDFPAGFYAVAIPVMNVLVIPLLALLGMSDYSMPTDWLSWLRSIVVVLLSSLISLLTYDAGIKPLKTYVRET